MFGRRWFCGVFFGARFWGGGSDTPAEEPTIVALARYTITAAPRLTTITAAARRLEIRK